MRLSLPRLRRRAEQSAGVVHRPIAELLDVTAALNLHPAAAHVEGVTFDRTSPLETLLTAGGDARIALDPKTGVNGYGCRGAPDPQLAAFGSSTASTISPLGQEAAALMLKRLQGVSIRVVDEAARLRAELLALCGVPRASGVEAILAPSGTEAHLLFSQLVASAPGRRPVVVMPHACETGSGVPAALAGRHFGDLSSLGAEVVKGEPLAGSIQPEVAVFRLRRTDGVARSAEEIEAEVEALIQGGIADERRVLLVAVDGSKTGLVAPRHRTIAAWKTRYRDRLEVLVDACQFRLAPSTVRAYLDTGCVVAVTGSKFVGGPIFSGALLVPPYAAARLKALRPPAGLGDYSTRLDWPEGWAASTALPREANVGLLLRWEAALAELRRFREVPEERILKIVQYCGAEIRGRMPMIGVQPIADAAIDRSGGRFAAAWDSTATILPFEIRVGAGLRRMSLAESVGAYRLASLAPRGLRVQVGQPVVYGAEAETSKVALRLSLSAPLISAAAGRGGAESLIESALAALAVVRRCAETVCA